jgi:hypothetical protein
VTLWVNLDDVTHFVVGKVMHTEYRVLHVSEELVFSESGRIWVEGWRVQGANGGTVSKALLKVRGSLTEGPDTWQETWEFPFSRDDFTRTSAGIDAMLQRVSGINRPIGLKVEVVSRPVSWMEITFSLAFPSGEIATSGVFRFDRGTGFDMSIGYKDGADLDEFLKALQAAVGQ